MADDIKKQTGSLKGGLTFGMTVGAYDGREERARGRTDKDLYGVGMFGDNLAELKSGKLAEDFMIPPLSVMSARDGWWQDRKRAWLALGIKSELGRGENALGLSEQQPQQMSAGSAYVDEHGKRQTGYDRSKKEDLTWGTGNDLDGYRRGKGMSKTVSNIPTDAAGTLLIDQYRGKRALNSSLAHAAPGGSAMPAMNYKNRERGTGAGRAIAGTAAGQPTETTPEIIRRPPAIRPTAPEPVVGEEIVHRAAPPVPSQPVVAAPRPRMGIPTIIVGTAKKNDEPKPVKITTQESSLIIKAREHGDGIISFDEATWDDQPAGSAAVGVDVEDYENFFLVCFRRFDKTEKKIAFEFSDRTPLDKDRLLQIMTTECLITFNGMSYDIPMIFLALKGATLRELKAASDHIIRDKVKYWEIEEHLGIKIPSINHVDLKEPNPSVRQSLKTLNGRLHGKRLMDLPYPPETRLTHEQMNVVTLYCMESDLEGTRNLFYSLREPLQLRQILGRRYDMDLRSKSDAQVGEAIVRKRIETLIGRKVRRSADPYSGFFKYEIPPFISFETTYLKSILTTLRNAEFSVNGGGHVNTPDSLTDLKLQIGGTTYKMGIGGLHSTEGTRALISNDEFIAVDVDVAGHYPAIIVRLSELGLYPKQAGPEFTEVYRSMLNERNRAKRGAAAAKKAGDKAVEAPLKAESDGGKIANNGVFGKLLSVYSFLYHPPLGLACTLTGQLSVLMIIERAEAAGISAVSGNTDGVLFWCPRAKLELLTVMLKKWEEETGFEVETNYYKAVYNRDVNTYIAIKEDGTAKRKGVVGNPWSEGDLRGQLSKNPQMTACSDAVLELAKHGTPLEQSIRSNADVRNFLTIIKVEGGSTWRDTYLGKVVRYYWSTQGEPILYLTSKKKVSKTDGARPLMELPDSLPDDIDYARYVKEATELSYDLGVLERQTVFSRSKS